ncbi:MAG: hypothetical protein R3203_10060, partial [Pseudoalteromonas tetraodonis]|nr:hypothetical protein [Pseudoalteromonas tetraodonis]
SSFELRASSFELRASSFELRASGFGLRASSFELRASSFDKLNSLMVNTTRVFILIYPPSRSPPLATFKKTRYKIAAT